MTSVPPPQEGPQSHGPHGPIPGKTQASSSDDSKYAFLLTTPFAKMFEKTGAKPTAKQMKAIIDGILKNVLHQMKKNDERWKKAMRKLKRMEEGNDG